MFKASRFHTTNTSFGIVQELLKVRENVNQRLSVLRQFTFTPKREQRGPQSSDGSYLGGLPKLTHTLGLSMAVSIARPMRTTFVPSLKASYDVDILSLLD